MRAMILAAGRGQRMRPLTDTTPKPLLCCNGHALIDRHLAALARAGFEEVVINLAWLGEQIRAHVGDGTQWGLTVRFSDEGKTPLDTAGGIQHALALLTDGDAPFVVVNGDVVTDYPFERLAVADGDLAHLVLVDPPAECEHGDFGLEDGRVRDDTPPALTFAGIGVYRPALFAGQAQGPAPLAPLLRNAIAEGRVSGERYTGFWRDVGTPMRLSETEAALAHRSRAG